MCLSVLVIVLYIVSVPKPIANPVGVIVSVCV